MYGKRYCATSDRKHIFSTQVETHDGETSVLNTHFLNSVPVNTVDQLKNLSQKEGSDVHQQ